MNVRNKLGFPGVSKVKNLPTKGDMVSTPGSRRSLEEERETHSSILAWKIPRTEEPGDLQSTGLQKSQTWVGD